MQDVLREIRTESGRHFDPRLTEIFLAMAEQLHAELGYESPAGEPRTGRPAPVAAG